jgi:hypothetical protein
VPNIRCKSVGRELLSAFFAYTAVYLLAPGHIVKTYIQLSAAASLRGRSIIPVDGHPPAVSSNMLVRGHYRMLRAGDAAVTCALHGDCGHAIQGPPIIALVGRLVVDRLGQHKRDEKAIPF